jgi:hypothetical protein
MANLETQILDSIIDKSRRKLLTLGGAAMAGLAFAASPKEAHAATSYSDADILNFALNLEYLEANFYYLAAFGCTIDKPNSAAITAGAPSAGIPITGSVGTPGTVTATGTTKVPFLNDVTIASYCNETAIEEGKHVLFLQAALGSAAVAQPAINLDAAPGGAWPTLATAAGIPGGAAFSPYTSDLNFLVGAYVFEDVGVTAYHGAASLLTVSGNLSAAAGILAVEAYHAGLVRTSITLNDPNATTIGAYTGMISNLRASLAKAGLLGVAPSAYDANPDDYGTANTTVSLGGVSYPATRIIDADPTNEYAFARNTTQVLNIVTGGGAVSGTTAVSPAKGVFFPAGMNAGPNGFK